MVLGLLSSTTMVALKLRSLFSWPTLKMVAYLKHLKVLSPHPCPVHYNAAWHNGCTVWDGCLFETTISTHFLQIIMLIDLLDLPTVQWLHWCKEIQPSLDWKPTWDNYMMCPSPFCFLFLFNIHQNILKQWLHWKQEVQEDLANDLKLLQCCLICLILDLPYHGCTDAKKPKEVQSARCIRWIYHFLSIYLPWLHYNFTPNLFTFITHCNALYSRK